MFFGYNVGSTIQRAISNTINIAYQPSNTIVDNYISNLLDQPNTLVLMPSLDIGQRPNNVMVIPEVNAPALYYDCCIGSIEIAKYLDHMHLPGIINVTNLLTINSQVLQKCRHMTFICYDQITYNKLTQELGILKTHLIDPAIIDEFVSNSIYAKNKNIDLAIMQNSNDQSKIEQILTTIQTSLPNIKIQIIQPNSTNEYLYKVLSETKIIFSADPLSIIEARYAMCFGNLLFTSDNRTIQYPGLVYQVSSIDQIIQGIQPLLTNYTQVFNKLSMEKNKMLLDNNFAKTQSDIYNLLSTVTQKART